MYVRTTRLGIEPRLMVYTTALPTELPKFYVLYTRGRDDGANSVIVHVAITGFEIIS